MESVQHSFRISTTRSLIGFLGTLDEFLAMVIPFIWGILTGAARHDRVWCWRCLDGWGFPKTQSRPGLHRWVFHMAYWYLPSSFNRTEGDGRPPHPSHDGGLIWIHSLTGTGAIRKRGASKAAQHCWVSPAPPRADCWRGLPGPAC